jgi:curli biogenesis system outer membrane secretion channel CsgG
MKSFCAAQAIAALLAAGPLSAQDIASDQLEQTVADAVLRPSLTVAEFQTDRTGWMPPPHLGETLAELLTDRLVTSGQYRITDRVWLLSESDPRRGTSFGSPFDRLRERAASAGVDYVVAGAVTRFSTEKRQRTGGGLLPVPIVGGLLKRSRIESVIGLTLRVIAVRTGEVVATATADSAASQTSTKGGGLAVIGGVPIPVVVAGGSSVTGFQDRLLDEAVQRAITSAAQRLVDEKPRLK